MRPWPLGHGNERVCCRSPRPSGGFNEAVTSRSRKLGRDARDRRPAACFNEAVTSRSRKQPRGFDCDGTEACKGFNEAVTSRSRKLGEAAGQLGIKTELQ